MADKIYGVEALARLLHESGREAVEKRLIYRDDVPVKPFCEWDVLPEPAREGRRVMARFLISHAPEVLRHLIDGQAFGGLVSQALDHLLTPVEPSRK